MSTLWERLYKEHAFKTHPSLWELAESHVPFDRLGVERPPEPRVVNAIDERDGVGLVLGPSGRGKSSALAYVAANLDSAPDGQQRYLPLFVPVAARADPSMDIDRFGQEVIHEFLAALAHALDPATKKRLQEALAKEVSRQHSPSVFNAKLVPQIPGLRAEIGVTFAHDAVTLVGQAGLDSSGGLRTLNDIARTQGYELVVLVEDTDQWAQREDGADTAETFFSRVLRPLVADADLAIIVAVQDRWNDERYYKDVAERAVAVIPTPAITARPQAREAVSLVLDQRVRRVLDGPAPDVIEALFTASALDILAADLAKEGSLRTPLARLRNTLDYYADALPDRIDDEHLIEGAE